MAWTTCWHSSNSEDACYWYLGYWNIETIHCCSMCGCDRLCRTTFRCKCFYGFSLFVFNPYTFSALAWCDQWTYGLFDKWSKFWEPQRNFTRNVGLYLPRYWCTCKFVHFVFYLMNISNFSSRFLKSKQTQFSQLSCTEWEKKRRRITFALLQLMLCLMLLSSHTIIFKVK